jgi:hypothetical protein
MTDLGDGVLVSESQIAAVCPDGESFKLILRTGHEITLSSAQREKLQDARAKHKRLADDTLDDYKYGGFPRNIP